MSGGFGNPSVGVNNVILNSVEDIVLTSLIVIPFVLLVVATLTVLSGNPYGFSTIPTEVIELSTMFACKNPLSTKVPVLLSTRITFGGSLKFLPPNVTVTTPTLFEFFN